MLESLCVVPAGMPSLPLSVPGGLFLAPLGSSMPSSIGFHAHQALYGGSPRSNGHVELFQRSSLPSGGSLPLKLPRSGFATTAAFSLLSCDMHVTTAVQLVIEACTLLTIQDLWHMHSRQGSQLPALFINPQRRITSREASPYMDRWAVVSRLMQTASADPGPSAAPGGLDAQ